MLGLKFRLCSATCVANISEASNISRNCLKKKKLPDFYSEAARSATLFRNSHSQLPHPAHRADRFSQSVRHSPREGHDKQSGASESAENMITIESRENNLMLQSNLRQPLQMRTHTSKHAHEHIRPNTNTYSLCMHISSSRVHFLLLVAAEERRQNYCALNKQSLTWKALRNSKPWPWVRACGSSPRAWLWSQCAIFPSHPHPSGGTIILPIHSGLVPINPLMCGRWRDTTRITATGDYR